MFDLIKYVIKNIRRKNLAKKRGSTTLTFTTSEKSPIYKMGVVVSDTHVHLGSRVFGIVISDVNNKSLIAISAVTDASPHRDVVITIMEGKVLVSRDPAYAKLGRAKTARLGYALAVEVHGLDAVLNTLQWMEEVESLKASVFQRHRAWLRQKYNTTNNAAA